MSDKQDTTVVVYRPDARDAVCIRVQRRDYFNQKSYRLTSEGSWVEYEGYEILPPTVEIPGIVLHELRKDPAEPVLDEILARLAVHLNHDRMVHGDV